MLLGTQHRASRRTIFGGNVSSHCKPVKIIELIDALTLFNIISRIITIMNFKWNLYMSSINKVQNRWDLSLKNIVFTFIMLRGTQHRTPKRTIFIENVFIHCKPVKMMELNDALTLFNIISRTFYLNMEINSVDNKFDEGAHQNFYKGRGGMDIQSSPLRGGRIFNKTKEWNSSKNFQFF